MCPTAASRGAVAYDQYGASCGRSQPQQRLLRFEPVLLGIERRFLGFGSSTMKSMATDDIGASADRPAMQSA
jgi:hypothetical protein